MKINNIALRSDQKGFLDQVYKKQRKDWERDQAIYEQKLWWRNYNTIVSTYNPFYNAWKSYND